MQSTTRSHVDIRNISTQVAMLLDRLAFLLLILLALTFAFEWMTPLFITNNQPYTNTETLIMLLIVVWAISRVIKQSWRKLPQAIVLPLLIWLVVLLLSAMQAPNYQPEALHFFKCMIEGAGVAWITFDMTKNVRRWRLVIYALVICGIAVFLIGLAEAANIAPVVDFLHHFRGGTTYVGEVVRVSSVLVYATIAAMVAELILPLLFAWILTERRLWRRVILALGMIAGLLMLILTLTRGGVAALIVGLLFMGGVAIAQQRRSYLIGVAVTGGVLAVLVVIVMLIDPLTLLRLITENDSSWYQAAYTAPDVIKARPGEVISVPIDVTNTSVRSWQADGAQPFRLSYHLYQQTGAGYEGVHNPLPKSIAPGETDHLTAQVIAPPDSGTYTIDWDMLQENVTWFSAKGATQGTSWLEVDGDPVNPDAVLPPSDYVASPPTINRLALWKVALQMAQSRPLLGVGPDNFRWAYGSYANTTQWDTHLHANNLYIEFLADTGIIGLLVFLWLSWRLFRTLWRGLKHQQNSEIWLLALMTSLLIWYVHGVVDYFYEFNATSIAFWLIAGLAMSAAVRHTESEA